VGTNQKAEEEEEEEQGRREEEEDEEAYSARRDLPPRFALVRYDVQQLALAMYPGRARFGRSWVYHFLREHGASFRKGRFHRIPDTRRLYVELIYSYETFWRDPMRASFRTYLEAGRP
jgi:hypothetical protein